MHVRPHLDYCDFIYHIPELQSNQNIESELDDQAEINKPTEDGKLVKISFVKEGKGVNDKEQKDE